MRTIITEMITSGKGRQKMNNNINNNGNSNGNDDKQVKKPKTPMTGSKKAGSFGYFLG